MPKFFVKNSDIINDNVYIKNNDFKHIKNVLRMKIGDKITISDEEHIDYNCEISDIKKDVIKLRILDIEKDIKESPLNITLYQAIPKGDKMAYIIQKNTELGISKIVPIITERIVVKLDEENKSKKVQKWQKISDEAAKQCRRSKIPIIGDIINLYDIKNEIDKFDAIFIPYECEEKNKLSLCIDKLDKIKNVAVIIGAEGGFSKKEIEYLSLDNVSIISLGPRILRTETAGLVINSILMYKFGDI